MSTTALIGLVLGAGFGLAVLMLTAGLCGWRPHRRPDLGPTRRGSVLRGLKSGRRVLYAVGAGLLVAAITRWPVAAAATVALTYLWPTMFGAGRVAAEQLERLEALATWTESLRDSIAGSVGLEEAVRHSVATAPATLQAHLVRLDGRVRAQIPLPRALASFADELDDPSADLVIAALILNSRLRGPGLVATLTALATAAREELDMRRRVEEGRRSLRRTALIIVSITGLFAGGLTVLSRAYVAPYSTPVGQVMLALVLGVFGGGLMWIRAAANPRPPERFLAAADHVDQALHAPSLAHIPAGFGEAR